MSTPNPLEELARKATEHARNRRFGEAADTWCELLRQKPDVAEAWLELGKVLAASNKMSSAVASVREALRLKPGIEPAAQMLSHWRMHPSIRYAVHMERLGVDFVFDVGAHRGGFGQDLRKLGYGGRIVSFEPVSASFHALRDVAKDDANWTIVHAGLGKARDELEIHVSAADDSSSFLPGITAQMQKSAPQAKFVASEKVPVLPLDEVFAQHGAPGRKVMLKIDTQGYELPVLEGAQGCMDQVLAVYVELSTVPLYEGQALLPEVCSWLYARGFRIVDLEPYMMDGSTLRLLQVNALFTREPA